MKNIKAVFMKQILDTIKNKTVFIQFLMFPIIAVIMENAVKIEDMPEHFFAKLFAVMFIGMSPLSCMSAIISEEKEKNTLRQALAVSCFCGCVYFHYVYGRYVRVCGTLRTQRQGAYNIYFLHGVRHYPVRAGRCGYRDIQQKSNGGDVPYAANNDDIFISAHAFNVQRQH